MRKEFLSRRTQSFLPPGAGKKEGIPTYRGEIPQEE
jgi:hypothetical protein